MEISESLNYLSESNGKLTQPYLVENPGLKNLLGGEADSDSLIFLPLCNLRLLKNFFFCLFFRWFPVSSCAFINFLD